MTRWVSTNVRHFVQAITLTEDNGDGIAGRIVGPDGTETTTYYLKQENPPKEYHIEVIGDTITDWLLMGNGDIRDRHSREIRDDDKVYIMDCILSGYLEQVP